jgi:2-hydroxy-6-oxonona-2,4-dienedioate hydrolase
MPVLVLHGAGGGHDMGRATAQMLLASGHHWIAPSRFGYLNSPILSDGSPAAQADAYVGLLDALDLRRVVVLAFSAGGPSALQFAARYHDRCAGLLLLQPVAHYSSLQAGWRDVGFRAMFASNLVLWLTTQYGRSLFLRLSGVSFDVQAQLTEEDYRWVSIYVQTMWPVEYRRQGLINDLARHSYPATYSPTHITVPTLIVHAIDDVLIPYENAQYAARHIAGARLITLNNGGHFMGGHHNAVRAEIKHFLVSAQ